MAAVDSFSLLYREIARSCSCYVEALALVGALYTGSKAATLIGSCYGLIRLHFIPRVAYSKDLVDKYGKWAIISGASEVIAIAYAEELASHGVCLVLVASDATGLKATARIISDKHGVQVVLLEADFRHGAPTCELLKDAVEDKDVGFVVNFLSSSLDIPRDFHEIPESELWRALNAGVSAASLVTRLALPGMAGRRRGAVVNVSSGRCSKPRGRRAALVASTAFFDHFSRALHCEYGRRGVFVQSLLPGSVSSGGDDGGIFAGWFSPQPQVYARHALSTLGVSHRTTGYWPHTLQRGFERCVPEWVWDLAARVTCGTAT